MTKIEVDIEQLRNLIGRKALYQGTRCTVIEVLENGPVLVLEACHQVTTIQPDQMGEAHRRVPHTISIPLLNKNKTEFSPAFLELEILDEKTSLD